MQILTYELFFALGILLQFVFSVGNKFEKSDIINILLSIAIGIIGTAKMASKADPSWTLEEMLFSTTVISSILLAGFFKERLLEEINELTLLGWNIIFWFVYIVHFGFWNYLTLALLVPTYLSAVVIFFNVKLNTFFKTFLYVWFLAILCYIGIIYFKFQNILFYKEINITDTPLSMIFAGMVFFYIIVNLVSILYLIPIPLNKHQTFSERMSDVKAHIRLLSSMYSDYQSRLTISLTTGLVFSGVLIINFYLHRFSETTLISLCMALLPAFAKKFDDYLSISNKPISIPLIKNS